MSKPDGFPIDQDCQDLPCNQPFVVCADLTGTGNSSEILCEDTYEKLFDVAISGFVIPAVGGFQSSVKVCDPTRWAVGQYFSIPHGKGKFQITKIDGDSIWFTNTSTDGLEILGNDAPGTQFPVGTKILPADSQLTSEFFRQNLINILNQSGSGDNYFKNVISEVLSTEENICLNAIPVADDECGYLVAASADCPDCDDPISFQPDSACLIKFEGIRNDDRTFYLQGMPVESQGRKTVLGFTRYFTFLAKDPICGKIAYIANSIITFSNKTIQLPSSVYTTLDRVYVGGNPDPYGGSGGGVLRNKNLLLINPANNDIERLETPSPNNNPDLFKNFWEAIHTETIGTPNGSLIRIHPDQTVTLDSILTNYGVEYTDNGSTKNVPDPVGAAGTNLHWSLIDDPTQGTYANRKSWKRVATGFVPDFKDLGTYSLPSGNWSNGQTITSQSISISPPTGAVAAVLYTEFSTDTDNENNGGQIMAVIGGEVAFRTNGTDAATDLAGGGEVTCPISGNTLTAILSCVVSIKTNGGSFKVRLRGWYCNPS